MTTLQEEAEKRNRELARLRREKPEKCVADKSDITGLNGYAPWWVKALATIGVPSAIALYLVVALVNDVAGAIEAHAQEQAGYAQIQINMMVQSCINGSDTGAEENACIQVANGSQPRRMR